VKEDRQRAILELVRDRPVHTQHELARVLGERGFTATQATVSRDIQELGLVRTGAGYRPAPPVSPVSELVISMTRVQFLMVIRTPPGTANLVARAVDEAGLDGVAGTLAGDDTILAVLAQDQAAERLRSFLGG
jgi:transcriptional regulator of arginine metabolism